MSRSVVPASIVNLASPPPRRRGGFSMVELVMVLAIMGILAAIAAPRYAIALANYRADAAANRVVADLNRARNDALATSSKRAVKFSTVNQNYIVHDTVVTAGYVRVDLWDRPYQATISSAVFGADSEVIFNGFGTPDSGGTVVIQSGNAARTVVLNANTGAAAIQ